MISDLTFFPGAPIPLPAFPGEGGAIGRLRPAYRFRPITEPMMMPDDAAEGRNPPDGADINFTLKAAPEKDKDGAVVREWFFQNPR